VHNIKREMADEEHADDGVIVAATLVADQAHGDGFQDDDPRRRPDSVANEEKLMDVCRRELATKAAREGATDPCDTAADLDLASTRAKQKESNTLNIIVAGHQGLGKSTAAMSMFEEYTDDSALTNAAASRKTQECRRLDKEIHQKEDEMQEKAAEEKAAIRAQELPRAKHLKVQKEELGREIQALKEKLDDEDEKARQKTRAFTELGEKIMNFEARYTGLAEVDTEIDYQAMETIEEEMRQEVQRIPEVLRTQLLADSELDALDMKDVLALLKGYEQDLRRELKADVDMIGGPVEDEPDRTTKVLREKCKFPIEFGPKRLTVTITDTPGYGDSQRPTEEIDRVVQEVKARFEEHEAARIRGGTEFAQIEEEDSMYHVCLYFIQPHRFTQIDEIFMKKLSPFVNLIPILAKADTMTQEEREKYLQEVRAKLKELPCKPYEFDKAHVSDFVAKLGQDAATMEAEGRPLDYKMPLAIVAKDRVYDWGEAKASNPLHSDLLCLQQMVVRDEPYLLRKETKKLFNMWSKQTRDQNDQMADRMAMMRRGAYSMIALLVLLLVSFMVPILGTSEVEGV
jgi:septin family protein